MVLNTGFEQRGGDKIAGMERFQDILVEQFTIELWRIPVVILAGLATYASFLLLVHVFGPRVLARMTHFDAVVIVMFGAVAGRVIVGHPPTLAAGLIGLATLMSMESIFGTIRSVSGFRRTLDGRARVVMAHGKIVEKHLKRSHMTRNDIRFAIRRAGIPSYAHVQCVILEANGELSVFRTGTPIEPELLKGVAGVESLYP